MAGFFWATAGLRFSGLGLGSLGLGVREIESLSHHMSTLDTFVSAWVGSWSLGFSMASWGGIGSCSHPLSKPGLPDRASWFASASSRFCVGQYTQQAYSGFVGNLLRYTTYSLDNHSKIVLAAHMAPKMLGTLWPCTGTGDIS